jgi:probable F420-dependent oxidoreductase
MDIGLNLPQGGATAGEVTDLAVAAERAGFESLWSFDRVLAPVAPRTPYPASADGELPAFMSSVLDPMLALTAAAAVTSTIRLGTSVLVAPWYPPLLLARAAASLDRLSGGRFTLGLGVGWSQDEFAGVGVPMAGRGQRLEEILDVLDAAWTEEIVAVTTRREHVAPSVIGLKPTNGRVPVLLAAYTPSGLGRIARRGDGWLPAGVPLAGMAGIWQGACDAAERNGRDGRCLRLTVLANVAIVDGLSGGRPDFVGSLDQVRDDINRCRDLGADELIVNLAQVASNAEDVLDLALSLTTPAAVGV